MPAPIRALADAHLYDPVTVKVKAATLTIDTVEQFFLETRPQEKVGSLVRVLEAEQPQQAIVFTRTKIRTEQLYRTLRDEGMNVKALHGDIAGRPRRRDDHVQGPGGSRSSSPPTSPPAGSTSRRSPTSSTSTSRPRPTSTCTGSAAPAVWGGRAARSVHRAAPAARPRGLIEKHAGTQVAPWAEGAHVAPARTHEPPRRHRKPRRQRPRRIRQADRLRRPRRRPRRGRPHHAVTSQAGLDIEAVRSVRLLERFALLEVPAGDIGGSPARSTAQRSEATRSGSSPRGLSPAEGQAATVGAMSQMTMTTNHGDIVLELFDEDAPETGGPSAASPKGFYDGLIFHRVIPDFMNPGRLPGGRHGRPGLHVQGRDQRPQDRQGAGDGERRAEHQRLAVLHRHHPRPRHWLDGKHTVFGEVSEGMDVVDKIGTLPTDPRDRPTQEARVERLAASA